MMGGRGPAPPGATAGGPLRLRRLAREVGRALRTRYPRFALGLPPPAEEIPVFVYHDVEPEEFAADLTFLAANGYRTLGLEEFVDARRRGSRPRAVLLTFDDARRSFWRVAFPLLREHGARAALFAPTAWISPPTDGGAGTASAPPAFLTWEELAECAGSGLVDVQPHGHRHSLVVVSPELEGFATPWTLEAYDIFEWPLRTEEGVERLGPPPLGTPIFRSVPLLSATGRMVEAPEVVEACRRLVATEGGEAFFEHPGWSARLRSTLGAALRRFGPGRRMDGGAFERLVASEFQLSGDSFRQRLGVPPRHFCFPWMLGSPLALRIAAEAGITAVFGVGLDFRRAARVEPPLLAFGRYRSDWLRFLPGRGRRQLSDALATRVQAALRPRHLAH